MEKKEEIVVAPGVYGVGDGKYVNYEGIPCGPDGKGLNGENLRTTETVDDLRDKIAELQAQLASVQEKKEEEK